MCDSAILVIAAEKVSNRRATIIKNQLAKSGVHILGVVLNRVRNARLRYPKAYGATGTYSKRYKENTKNGGAPKEENLVRAKDID